MILSKAHSMRISTIPGSLSGEAQRIIRESERNALLAKPLNNSIGVPADVACISVESDGKRLSNFPIL